MYKGIFTGDKMIDRKQQVIKRAHQLFLEKGFQATSIQDILDYTGISKGTFYNYFSSKNELLIAILKTIFEETERERNEMLLGEDPANIQIFIKQIEWQMEKYHLNKISALFGEIIVSGDDELKQFVNETHQHALEWLYTRFIDIFGEDKKDYLLDCAIIFLAICNQTLRYFPLNSNWRTNLERVVNYSVNRITTIVEDVTKTREQLFPPETLEIWIKKNVSKHETFKKELQQTISALKKELKTTEEQIKYGELFHFIQEEAEKKEPRQHLLAAVLTTIKKEKNRFSQNDVEKLEHLIQSNLK